MKNMNPKIVEIIDERTLEFKCKFAVENGFRAYYQAVG